MVLPVVGLTGGIASGKSTAGRMFRELGVPVVDADQLAREVVLPGTEGLTEIVSAFGLDVLQADGTLDRKTLAGRVFADAALRARLNAITHPRIAALAAARLRDLSEQGHPYVMYEAALIVENGMHRAMSALVVVASEVDTQLARLMNRDALSHADAHARVQAQAPLAQKLAVADFVIVNDGSEIALRERVREVDDALRARMTRGN
jgi:dephospho-CoA kinase